MARVAQQRKAAVDTLMRDSIYHAAVKVLQEFGLDGITMERVAKEAEVAKGTLYNYYQDKDGLVQDVYNRMLDPMFEAMERIRSSRLPPTRKLEEIVREALIFFETNRVTLHIFGKSDPRSGRREAPHRRGLEIFEAVLEEGLSEGSFGFMNARHVAQLVVGALVGFLESLDHRDAALDIDSDFREIMSFYLHGLSAMG